MKDPIPELMNLQLLALGQIRKQLETNSDRLIRIENKLESISRNVERHNKKLETL